MFQESEFRATLEAHSFDENGHPLVIYGDPAYGQFLHMIAPYRSDRLTPEQQRFNFQMSSVRESVEWGFGKIAQYFAFVDFKKNQKLFLQAVGKSYLVAGILTNLHTCINDSITARFFEIDPPTVEEYLAFIHM